MKKGTERKIEEANKRIVERIKEWISDKGEVGRTVVIVVITAVIMYWIMPTKEIQTEGGIIVIADSGKVGREEVERAEKRYQELLGEVGWLKKKLRLAEEINASGGGVIKPTINLLNTVEIIDSNKIQRYPLLYAYDFPISMGVSKKKIWLLTMNPYLQYMGEPYEKVYEFKRKTMDFEMAIEETREAEYLNGIRMRMNERLISFEGIRVGMGGEWNNSDKGKRIYAMIEGEMKVYNRILVAPRITSQPSIGIELKYSIIQ